MRLTMTILFAAAMLSVATDATAAASSIRRIYKVDNVAATIDGDKLTVNATGAAVTGGWGHTRLRLKSIPHREPNRLVFEFVAAPPSPKMAVVQMLVPVNATITIRTPHFIVKHVDVEAEMNSAEAQVITH